MIILTFVLMFNAFVQSRDFENKLDRYIISCRTTDYECFKRQYRALRDNVLLGNQQLKIDTYQPYQFQYGDSGTCVKVTGVEDSELVAISVDSINRELALILTQPIRLQQVRNSSEASDMSDKDFAPIGPHVGPLKKYTGNGSVQVTFPFRLRKKKGSIYMILEDEDVDAIMDIPDLSAYDRTSEYDTTLYDWSEWAYKVVQHVDIAQHCLLPYTGHLKSLFDKLPLERFILLYPDEEYSNLQFLYADSVDV